MEEKHEFEVHVRGIPGDKEDERHRAEQALASQLPSLSEDELAVAKKFGMSSEEY